MIGAAFERTGAALGAATAAARFAFDATIGLIVLAVRALASPGGLRGPYWTWRWDTAFGRGAPSRPELMIALLRYAAWTRRMRRLE